MSGDVPTGDHLVCPRCGAAAANETFCTVCGLDLAKQSTLPTADAYAASVRERRWLEAQKRPGDSDPSEREATEEVADLAPISRGSATAGGTVTKRIRRRGIAAAVGIALLVLAAVFVLSAKDDETTKRARCGDVIVEPNSDNALLQVQASGVSCERAESLLLAWGQAGYQPQTGPPGYTCGSEQVGAAEARSTCTGDSGEVIRYTTGYTTGP